jgi:hypothetical protein
VLQVFDSSVAPHRVLYTLSGTRRRPSPKPGTLGAYLQYAPIALLVIGQIVFRVYMRKRGGAPSAAGLSQIRRPAASQGGGTSTRKTQVATQPAGPVASPVPVGTAPANARSDAGTSSSSGDGGAAATSGFEEDSKKDR